MPSEYLQHPLLNPDGTYGNSLPFNRSAGNKERDRKIKKIKKDITAKEFINLISGKYGHEYQQDSISEHFKDHPHNNPKNVDIAIRQMQAENQDKVKSIIEHHHASPQMIDKMIENPEDYGLMSNHTNKRDIKPAIMEHLADQKHLSTDHIRKMVNSQDPFMASDELMDRMVLEDPDSVEALAKNPNATMSSDLITRLAATHKQNPNILGADADNTFHNILKRHRNLDSGHIDRVLDAMSPEARKSFIDKTIGLEGGHHDDEDNAANPSFNWNNWTPGDDHHSVIAETLASSKFLDENQADHIMRHGDLDDRWNLFNNTNIPNKHADHMYTKWTNDDSDHGYDIDEFKEKIKENNEFEFEDYMEEAREKAEEEYPMSDYMKDRYRNDEESLVGKSKEDWIDEHLDENYDWEHKNPTEDDPDNVDDHSGRYKDDHPEYQERYDEAESAYDKHVDHLMSNPDDHHYDNYSESIRDSEYEIAHRLHDDKMDNAHEDPDFLPKHLSSVVDLKRKQAEAKENSAFEEANDKERQVKGVLDQFIPNRVKEHNYGEGQHHIELAKDYADANNGTVDIGHLNKMHPNMIDKWKNIFAGKGKLTSDELQQKIDQVPKRKYNISYGHWEPNNMQNINGQHEMVIRLDHSPESLREMKQDPEVYDTFNKINEAAQRSGHPSNFNTIGWARVDFTNPKHPFIDEAQSDFSSAARDYIKKEGGDKGAEKAKSLDKIISIQKGWREALLNHVIKTAKAHGAEKISTHSPESKSAHTGASKVHSVYKDSYEKVPRQLGFKATDMETLPLSDEGKRTFKTGRNGTPTKDLIDRHALGLEVHSKMWHHHNNLEQRPSDDALVPYHKQLSQYHADKYKQHYNRLTELDPTHDARNAKTPSSFLNQTSYVPITEDRISAIGTAQGMEQKGHELPTYSFDDALNEQPQLSNGHQGHTLNLSPDAFKKHILMINTLMKSQSKSDKMAVAQALMNIESQKEQIEQLKQENPEVYQNIMDLTQLLVEMFKEINKEPIEAIMHEAEAKDAMQESQPQEQATEQAPKEASVRPPRHVGKITHGDKTMPVGSVREYKPGVAREKMQDGSWKSVAGGIKRFDEQ